MGRTSVTEQRPVQLTPARWRVRLRRWLAAGDGLVITAGSLLAYVTREQLGRIDVARPLADEVSIAIAIIPLWLLLFALAGAYRPEYLNSGGDGARRFLVGVGGGVLTLGFASFLFNLQLSRLFVLFVALYVLVGGGVLRAVVRRWIRRRHARGELVLSALIVGIDEDAQQLAAALDRDRDSSYRVAGYLDETAPIGSTAQDGRRVLGRPTEVIALASEHRVGLVIVSPVGVSRGTLQDVILDLEGTAVDVAVAPSLFQIVTRRMTIETVGYVPILHVDQVRLGRSERILKRSVDLVAASALLLLTLPVWAWAAFRVRTGSPGPVLFRQRRVGQDGQSFEMLKFRTMVKDAEARLSEVKHLNEAEGAFFKVAEDPRVTAVGRTLRRWSIDELPQLVNVLRGDMSMVGPRPPLPSEVATYEEWHRRRLRVRPGITGIWQVSGRSDVAFDEAVRLDLFYIENWSLGTDLAILARTVRAVLSRRGAW